MATLIDQLTVKLGLDPSDFKKGVNEAKKSMDDLRGRSEQNGEAIGTMFQAGARRATGSLGILGSTLGRGGALGVGIGAAIFLAKKLDDELFQVALGLRQVGIDSKNLNETANRLRILQNASALAGGSMEDATQSVGDLQKSLFNLRFNGQVSDQIVMLSRLGVQFQDSYGKARSFNSVMLDTADALEKEQAAGRMTRGEAFEFAQQAGFTGGMAQLVLKGRKGLEIELSKQAFRSEITPEIVGAADKWVASSISVGQAKEAEVFAPGVGAYGNDRAAANEIAEQGLTVSARLTRAHSDDLANGALRAAASLNPFTNAVASATDALEGLQKLFGDKPAPAKSAGATAKPAAMSQAGQYAPAIREAARKYGVPEEVLAGVLRTESNFNPDAVNPKSGAKGIAQFMPNTAKQYGVTPGGDPADDIDGAARFLKDLQKQAKAMGYGDDVDIMPWVVAAAGYNAGMKNVRTGDRIGPDALAYPGKVMSGVAGAQDAVNRFQQERPSITNDVVIQQITVTTQATDAEGIASGIGDSVRRKLLTSQFEPGPQ